MTALIQEANRRVYERAHSDPSTSGMGTTMTVALVEGDEVTIGHVGDSRAYVVRGGELEQLTEDHSLVNELLKSGKLSREEAETHPQRSVITRAVGTDPDVDVDAFTVERRRGRRLPALLRRADRHGRATPTSSTSSRSTATISTARRRRSSRRRTAAAARTTSPSIAFSIAADGDETVRMDAPIGRGHARSASRSPTVDTMVVPPEEVEDVFVEPGSRRGGGGRRSRSRSHPAARIRLVLTMLALLGVAAVLLVWGLVR